MNDPFEEYAFDDLLREKEWRKCAPAWDRGADARIAGFIYFCENYWFIKHPERGRIKFEPFEAQIETIDSWMRNRYSLVLKARQIGFSTLVAAYSFWLAYFYRDKPIIMLSRTERDAVKLLSKAKYGLRFMPEWMRWRGPPFTENQLKLEFANGSSIESLPSTNPARGDAAYLIVADEFAFLTNPDEAWSSMEPAADVGGRIIVLSTANGYGNLFHSMWVGSQNGTNRFKALFHPWSAGDRTEEWYAEKKKDTPEWQMAQEYPNDAEEAFLKSGRPVFDLEFLRELPVCAPQSRGYLRWMGSKSEYVDDGGALRIWEFPKENGRYVIGADVAMGYDYGDFSSAHVIDARTHEVVAHWHGNVDPDLFGSDILFPLGMFYRRALMGVENNNHGLTTLKALQRQRYFPIYYQRSVNTRTPEQSPILGWRTTQVTKPLAIDELRLALRNGMQMFCDETRAELLTFVRDEDGKMHGSPFDDRVISLAIANQMLKHVWLKQYEPPTSPPPGTFGYMERMLLGELERNPNERKPRTPIGANYVRSR